MSTGGRSPRAAAPQRGAEASSEVIDEPFSVAWSGLAGDLPDEPRRLVRGQGLAADLVNDLQVALDVRALVQVDGVRELLKVNDVGQVPFLEAQHGERPALARVSAPGERDDLEGHVRKPGYLDEVPVLCAHHF